MSFPPSFLEEIRNRLPMSEIAGKRLRLTRAGREFKACCPFHNEKTPSFYINDDKQFFHCFGCGAHGDVIGFTMRLDRLSFPEAVETLAAQAGLPVPQNTPMERERFDREKRLYQVLERATAFFEEQLFAPAGREARSYIGERGLSEDAIRRFRLGYAPNDSQALIKKLVTEGFKMEELLELGLAKKSADRDEYFSFFRNRVIFPVGDRKGRTVAFGGRVMGDGEPKYLNSPDHVLFHKGKLLYGLSRARAAATQGQPLIVAEGYMDVIALVEAGYIGAVAPLGTALTEDQLFALWKLLPPADARDPARDYSPILCFDGDSAGLRAAARAVERALPLLTATQTVRVATLPAGQDPDDLIRKSGKSAFDAVLGQAKPMIDAIWDLTAAGRRLQTPEERGAFMAALKQRIGRIGDETLRRLYHDDMQKRLAALFNWRGKETEGGRPQWKGQASPTIVPITRKQPPDVRRQRERALLALIINHPSLFGDFGEDLAHLAFAAPEFEALRERVIGILSLDSQEPLDAAGLYRHLSGSGNADKTAPENWQAGLAEVLSEATYVHVGFARPDRSIEQARHGWKSIWSMHMQEQLKADLEAARRQHGEENSDESLMRLLALREQVESLSRQADEGTSAELAAFSGQES